MKVKSESEVDQSYLTLRNPVDCSLPGSSIHGIFQARVLEWVAIAFSISLYRKIQESGLPEIIPFICISAIWGQNPVFSHPEFPQGSL